MSTTRPENKDPQDMGQHGPEETDVQDRATPKYIGLVVTPENRNKLSRMHGREEVNRQIKMFRAYMKGKKFFTWRGQIYPVMTTDILSQERFTPTTTK